VIFKIALLNEGKLNEKIINDFGFCWFVFDGYKCMGG
jgi:hypothetical protein